LLSEFRKIVQGKAETRSNIVYTSSVENAALDGFAELPSGEAISSHLLCCISLEVIKTSPALMRLAADGL
jgi:hypothetical protein